MTTLIPLWKLINIPFRVTELAPWIMEGVLAVTGCAKIFYRKILQSLRKQERKDNFLKNNKKMKSKHRVAVISREQEALVSGKCKITVRSLPSRWPAIHHHGRTDYHTVTMVYLHLVLKPANDNIIYLVLYRLWHLFSSASKYYSSMWQF